MQQRFTAVLPLIAMVAIASPPAAQSLAAQSVPVTRYTTPAAELKAEFSSIASIAELRDGRVLIVDSKDDRLVLGNFADNTASTIGRNGDGPREYRRVSRVVPVGGDTVLVRSGSRYLYYTAAGGLSDKVITDLALLMMVPTGSDRAGRLYFQGPLMSFKERRSFDSVPVYRVDRRSLRGDTIASARFYLEPVEEATGNVDDHTRRGHQGGCLTQLRIPWRRIRRHPRHP